MTQKIKNNFIYIPLPLSITFPTIHYLTCIKYMYIAIFKEELKKLVAQHWKTYSQNLS